MLVRIAVVGAVMLNAAWIIFVLYLVFWALLSN